MADQPPMDQGPGSPTAQALSMATTELEYRVDLLNRMVVSCHEKCASRPYKDGQLSVGENSCVDRCCSKYWGVVAIVGQLLGAQR